MNRKVAGFTLIELMITVVVFSIIAVIAVPTYRDYVSKSRRADAKAALLNLSLAEEKWRANNIAYTGTLSNLGSSSSPEGYYTLSVVSWTTTSYLLQATRNASGPQNNDGCGNYRINQNGVKTLLSYTYPTTYQCGW